MAVAVPAASPLFSDLRTPHHRALLSMAGAGVGIIAGTLDLALASDQLGAQALRRLLVGWIGHRVNRMAAIVLFAVERPFCESLWGATRGPACDTVRW